MAGVGQTSTTVATAASNQEVKSMTMSTSQKPRVVDIGDLVLRFLNGKSKRWVCALFSLGWNDKKKGELVIDFHYSGDYTLCNLVDAKEIKEGNTRKEKIKAALSKVQSIRMSAPLQHIVIAATGSNTVVFSLCTMQKAMHDANPDWHVDIFPGLLNPLALSQSNVVLTRVYVLQENKVDIAVLVQNAVLKALLLC
jgi:hypothetical protein